MSNDVICQPLPWPPIYCWRQSTNKRSRSVRLQISRTGQLELIVPPRFKIDEIPEILENNRSWIEKKLREYHLKPVAASHSPFPNEIDFPAIAKSWRVYYEKCDRNLRLIIRPNNEIVIFGKNEQMSKAKSLLTQWVKQQAQLHLLQWFDQISQQTQLTYQTSKIRLLTARWGSCDVDKNITLNSKLLFLQPSLVQHIFIHELCHTIHLDHSAKFWRLVARHDRDWQIHRRTMRESLHHIPAWIN